MSKLPEIKSVYFVPGLPHVLLAPEKSSKWQSVNDSYKRVREQLKKDKPESLLIFSASWYSIVGHLIQADPNPKHYLVDHNWHELGTMNYDFPVDTKFSASCQKKIQKKGYTAKLINYEGFPVDAGTIVAQKLLNPDNEFSCSVMSWNIYADKKEYLDVGAACREAIEEQGKDVSVVIVSSLSSKLFTHDIDPEQDKISSESDDKWNQKILGAFEKGSVAELSQIAPDFAKEGHADMGFRSIWWLEGLLGAKVKCEGRVFDYQPVWGTGAALCGLYPKVFDKPEDTEEETSASSTEASGNILSEKAAEPVGSYPHAKVVDNLVFLSGIGPREKGAGAIPGLSPEKTLVKDRYDVEVQTRSVIRNLEYVLEKSGSSKEDILDIQVYLLDMKSHFKTFNKVYSEYFSKETGPARTTIEIKSLPTDIAVEFKVIAKKSAA